MNPFNLTGVKSSSIPNASNNPPRSVAEDFFGEGRLLSLCQPEPTILVRMAYCFVAAGALGHEKAGAKVAKMIAKNEINVAQVLENGDAKVQYALGMMFLNGTGVGQDNEKAAQLFLAASKDHTPTNSDSVDKAKMQLVEMISNEQLVYSLEVMNQSALDVLLFAAQQGSHQASYQLGLYFKTFDLRTATKFFMEAHATIPDACTELANLVCSSDMVKEFVGPEQVEKIVQRAADELKHPDAAFHYAGLLAKRESSIWDRESPQDKALPYYKMAADVGHKAAKLEYLTIIAEKLASSPFLMDSINFFNNERAEKNKEYAESAYQLGMAYSGIGNELDVRLDENKAIKYLKLAADQRLGKAAYQLSNWCGYASTYFRIAVEENYLPAVLEQQVEHRAKTAGNDAFMLYQFHHAGDSYLGLPKDKVKAARYFNEALKYNHPEATDKIVSKFGSDIQNSPHFQEMKKDQEIKSEQAADAMNKDARIALGIESKPITETMQELFDDVSDSVVNIDRATTAALLAPVKNVVNGLEMIGKGVIKAASPILSLQAKPNKGNSEKGESVSVNHPEQNNVQKNIDKKEIISYLDPNKDYPSTYPEEPWLIDTKK